MDPISPDVRAAYWIFAFFFAAKDHSRKSHCTSATPMIPKPRIRDKQAKASGHRDASVKLLDNDDLQATIGFGFSNETGQEHHGSREARGRHYAAKT